jgi:hypothetical protein
MARMPTLSEGVPLASTCPTGHDMDNERMIVIEGHPLRPQEQ